MFRIECAKTPAQIWEWIDAGGYFTYVATPAGWPRTLIKLIDIVGEQGGMDETAAAAYVKQMQRISATAETCIEPASPIDY